MKQIILTIFLLSILFLNINAQETEIFGELIPYTKWLENEIEKNRGVDIFYSTSGKLNIETFNIGTKILQNGEAVAVIKMVAKSNDLIYRERDGKLVSETKFWGRITSKDKNFDNVFEEIIPVTIEMSQMDKIFPVIFQRLYKLPKDKYTISLLVKDVASGWKATKKIKFEIK